MPNLVIIFEGHDCSGKSSIAIELSKILGIPYFKNPKEHEWLKKGKMVDATRYGGLYLANFIAIAKYPVIMDRGYASEYVYSKVFGRQTDIGAIFEIDRIYADIGAKIVYCYKDDLTDYQDELVDVEHVNAIKVAYEEFFKLTKCEVFRLNTDDKDLDRQIVEIMRWLRNVKRSCQYGNEYWLRHAGCPY